MRYNNTRNSKSSVFVITRFNLRLFPKDKKGKSTISEEWLDDRLYLFEKFCVPSIIGQTFSDFIWLCFFDETTPPRYQMKIEEISQYCKNLFPVYLTFEETKSYTIFIKKVISDLRNEESILITTRIDNDDAYHYSYLNEVVRAAKRMDLYKGKDTVVSFKNGLQYYVDYNIATRIAYVHNHFTALIVQNSGIFNAVTDFNHSKIECADVDFCCLNNIQPMWTEVIHQRNVGNDIYPSIWQYPIFGKYYMKEDFSIDIELHLFHTISNYIAFLFPNLVFKLINKLISHFKNLIFQ